MRTRKTNGCLFAIECEVRTSIAGEKGPFAALSSIATCSQSSGWGRWQTILQSTENAITLSFNPNPFVCHGCKRLVLNKHRLSREENRAQRSVNHANRQAIIQGVFLPRGVDEHVVLTSLRVTRASIPYTAVVHLHEADLSGSSAFIQRYPIPNGSNQNSRHIVVHRMQNSLHRSRARNSRSNQDA